MAIPYDAGRTRKHMAVHMVESKNALFYSNIRDFVSHLTYDLSKLKLFDKNVLAPPHGPVNHLLLSQNKLQPPFIFSNPKFNVKDSNGPL